MVFACIATERNTNVPFFHSDEVLLGSVPGILPVYYYSKLVVYQVPNLKVPHHHAKMVRVCFVRSLYVRDLFVSKTGFAPDRLCRGKKRKGRSARGGFGVVFCVLFIQRGRD